jgi:hypothetical protein
VQNLARQITVALISASTLAFEILLVRVFAIEHFHHFAYMAIGVAMLGLGISGTVLALCPKLKRQTTLRLFIGSSGLTALFLILTPAAVHQISLDPTQMAWDHSQWLRLGIVYLLLALPFALGALTVLTGLSLGGRAPGSIYGASFLGSGFGAGSGLAVLWILPPESALAFPSLLAALGFVAALAGAGTSRRTLILSWLTVAAAVSTLGWPPWKVTVSPYKGLPQIESYPDAKRTFEGGGPLGWTVAVDAAAFRFVPGLSLAFEGQIPPQEALFVDGAITGATTAWPEESDRDILDWLPTALPYTMGVPGNVLIVASGGDVEIWNALAHGASAATAVELNPYLVDASRSSQLISAENEGRVSWAVGDARSYVAQTDERFDVITLAPAGGFGTSVAGVHALAEDFLHTEEAYVAYLKRLSNNGVLAVTRWLDLPLRESVRVILTAVEALGSVTLNEIEDCIVVARSWGTVTVMVKPAGFTTSEIRAVGEWAESRLFDLDWYPGIEAPEPTFNYLEEPTLVAAVTAAISGGDRLASFTEAYPFNVAPVGDARPYPHHFLRVASLRDFLDAGRGSWLPFAEWGQIALLATLLQSTLLGGLFILAPAVWVGRQRRGHQWLPWMGYFTAIGLAYLAVEIAAIQQLALLLGHPIYAVAAVLTAFLICSGVGSLWSDRLRVSYTFTICSCLAVLLLLLCLFLLHLVHWLQPAGLPVRAGVATLLLAPAAFLMGTPFPLGLRSTGGTQPGRMAWAWAANGFASVVAAPLAALLALELGSPRLFLAGTFGYLTAAFLSRRIHSPRPSAHAV